MTRTMMLASLALTVIALLGLPILAFQRMGLIDFAPTSAPTHAVAIQEGPFLAEGTALVDVPRPAPSAQDGSERGELSALLAAEEPRSRTLYVDVDVAGLGAFDGVIHDARLKQTCHLAVGELRSADGDSIRLAMKMHSAAYYYDCVGTYSISGGTGKFQGATGRGSVFAATAGKRPLETLTLTLDGTISY
jgi:hypothetical protein